MIPAMPMLCRRARQGGGACDGKRWRAPLNVMPFRPTGLLAADQQPPCTLDEDSAA